jgi:hypothetical protein
MSAPAPRPAAGDYVLSPSGISWNVDRVTDRGSVLRVAAGERARDAAMTALRSRAEHDKVDAWQSEGPESYRLIAQRRPAAA